jgi:hypothetical protein
LRDRPERRRGPVDLPSEPCDHAALAEGQADGLLLARRPGKRLAPNDVDHGRTDLVERQHEVDGSRLDRGVRHRRLLGRLLALCDHDAA